MADLDVFHSDAFTTLSLTTAVERNPYLPQRIGQMDVFEEDGIYTTAMAVEERAGTLVLIPTSDRNAPPVERVTELRDARYFGVPRLAHGDTIKASEIQNIRAFGQESELMQVQAEVDRRLSGPTGLMANIEYTKENMRLGAISGTLVDSDGSSVIYNWFTQFGITQNADAPGVTYVGGAFSGFTANTSAEIPFNLTGWQAGSAFTTPDGFLRQLANQIVRAMKRAAKGAYIDGVTEIWAMCGDAFWDALITHPDIVKSYQNFIDARQLREATAFEGDFYWAGIHWFNYRGSDDNSTVAVPTTKVRFFLRKAPGVFQTAYAPAEFFPWVNTKGKPQYVLMFPDRDRQAFWRIEAYSYPLYICTRPETLLSGRLGT